MDIYGFIETCKEQGLSSAEALNELDRALAEEYERRMEDYYNDPEVQYGWYQQDMIDLRRRER